MILDDWCLVLGQEGGIIEKKPPRSLKADPSRLGQQLDSPFSQFAYISSNVSCSQHLHIPSNIALS
jgi:hypothetical protein